MIRNFGLMLILSLLFSLTPISSEAGQWVQYPYEETNMPESTWRYINDDGTCPKSMWLWIDGDRNGWAECYYFSSSSHNQTGGYMLANTVTPDGYDVNSDGAWVIDGNVQRISVPIVEAGATPCVRNDSEITLIGQSFDYVNEIYGSANISKLTETGNSIRYAIKNENIVIYSANNIITAVEVPWINIIDNLPITCSYHELDDILSTLGFQYQSGEYGLRYYNYKNFRFLREANMQYNIGEIVSISR